ncbi:MAG: hypothetical protein ACRD96_17615, partial [Bryobacteraceae bacterium]
MRGVLQTRLLEMAALAAIAAGLAGQLLVEPRVGLADKGDFARVIGRFSLGHTTSDSQERFYGYFRPRYEFHPR